MTDPRDGWAAALAYEAFMGRWSRRLAERFVSWLAIPADKAWLDVGCGTGALTRAVRELARPDAVVGCDPAAPFVRHARSHHRDPRATYVVAGVDGLPRRPGGFDSVASLLALNFFPDAEAGLRAMRSVTAPGGTISACVWDYADGMAFLRCFWDAAAALDERARERDEGLRFPLCRRDALAALFHGGGLAEVRCEAIEIPTVFASFDDLWRPLLGGTGPAPAYVASLDAERRARLAASLEASLPRAPDGTIALAARAWAVRGTREA